jgi:hypothetical protein
MMKRVGAGYTRLPSIEHAGWCNRLDRSCLHLDSVDHLHTGSDPANCFLCQLFVVITANSPRQFELVGTAVNSQEA